VANKQNQNRWLLQQSSKPVLLTGLQQHKKHPAKPTSSSTTASVQNRKKTSSQKEIIACYSFYARTNKPKNIETNSILPLLLLPLPSFLQAW